MRLAIALACIPVALSSYATAQSTANAAPIPGAVKNAGIYHVATNTWTRTGGSTAPFGPDTIYSNTAGSGYFGITSGPGSMGGAGGFLPGSEHVDEGGLPGTQNGNPFTGGAGPNRDTYLVDGFQIGYCDFNPAGTAGYELRFYEDYMPCTTPSNAPVRTITLSGLPAAGCWIMTVDLEGTPDEFCIGADGPATGWTGSSALDSFGWSYVYTGTVNTALGGFILTGDPQYTDPTWTTGTVPIDGTNTYYGAPSLCTGTGTGYLTRDFWWVQESGGAGATGCYFFGGYVNRNGCGGPQGNPHGSFWMELYADSTACSPSTCFGSVYCNSNPNSTGVTTQLELCGDPAASADNVRMRAFQMPNNSFGFFITSETQGFTANPAGSQGNICLAGNLGRFVAPGQIKNSMSSGEITLDTTLGEWSVTAIPTATGPYSAMMGSTTNFQAWHRDSSGGMATSNFSDGVSHTWL